MIRLGVVSRTLLLALVSAAGIVGMLLADGLGDVFFFLLAALPLLAGGWSLYAVRRNGVVQRR